MWRALVSLFFLFRLASAYDLNIVGTSCNSVTYTMTLIPGEWTLGYSWNAQLFLSSGSSAYSQVRSYFGQDGFSSSSLTGTFTFTFSPALTHSYSDAYLRVEIDGLDGQAINYSNNNDPDFATIPVSFTCNTALVPTTTITTTTTTPFPTPTPTTRSSSSRSSSSFISSSSTTHFTPPTLVPQEINVGAVAGGTVGGIVALTGIALLVFFCCIRKRHGQQYDTEAYDGPAVAEVWSGAAGSHSSSEIEENKEPDSFVASSPTTANVLIHGAQAAESAREIGSSVSIVAPRQNPLLSPDQFTRATFCNRQSLA